MFGGEPGGLLRGARDHRRECAGVERRDGVVHPQTGQRAVPVDLGRHLIGLARRPRRDRLQPGEGLDCSGLTQWAYGEAGVGLPRLAQEQNVGTAVDPGDLMPGDLAVWDGHVAMVIGNGQLVEAGDPVQVGPIRTSNSGMGFYGFYRPTE